MTSRRNPFGELERLFERMQENFEEAARMWETRPLEGESTAGSVSVDLEDAGEELVLTADLPGFDRDDIDVRVTDRTLRITAEREEESEEREIDGEYLRRERRHETVSRSLTLPEDVERDEVHATYNNGVLTVRLPKSEPPEEGTRIDVN